MSKKEMTAEDEAEVRVGAYEVMFVVTPDLLESKLKKKQKELEEMIEKAAGKITHTDFWGTRHLAYPIKKKTDGIYMVMGITCPTGFVNELNTQLRLDPEVLRHLVMTLPKNYVYVNYSAEEARQAAQPAPDMRDRRPMMKNISLKHNAPAMAPKKEASPDAAPAKEMSAEELDKKLGDIIGGSDLNL